MGDLNCSPYDPLALKEVLSLILCETPQTGKCTQRITVKFALITLPNVRPELFTVRSLGLEGGHVINTR